MGRPYTSPGRNYGGASSGFSAEVSRLRSELAQERDKANATQAALGRLADAHAAAQAETKRLQGDIAALRTDTKALRDEEVLRAAQLKLLQEQVTESKQVLDKIDQKGHTSTSATVIDIDKASAESLKRELEEMDKRIQAFAVCLTLFSVHLCERAEAAPSSSNEPKVVAEVPTVESPDMWTKYPDYFARFKEVWTYCPVVLELKRAIEIARSYNDRTDLYERMIVVCKSDKAHIPNRAWPPTPAAAKMRKERFFVQKCEGEEGVCRWVQVK